jgi:hypothetical protein
MIVLITLIITMILPLDQTLDEMQVLILIDWPNIFKYLRNFIFHNQIKELFYKIRMRMCMIGHWVEKFGHSKLCVYYDQIEDKLHAFVQCNHIWSWFKDLVYALYSSF